MKVGFMDRRQFLKGSSLIKLLALLMLTIGNEGLGTRGQEAGMNECLLVWISSIMDGVTFSNDSDL